jgi:hypothetical protein
MFGVSRAVHELRTRMQSSMDSMIANTPKESKLREAHQEMQAALQRAFLDMLDLNSARQAGQKSRNVPGASSDFIRTFAKRAQWHDSTISNFYTAREYTRAFDGMRANIKELGSTDSVMATKGQEIADELAMRFSNSMKTVNAPVIHALSAFGHNFYLALSPAYMIGNMLQPSIMSLPFMGGRYGFVKTAKAMKGATVDVMKVLGKSLADSYQADGVRGVVEAKLSFAGSNMGKAELDFVNHLIRSGIVDATQFHELGRLARGESSTAATWARTMSSFNHYSEVMNRLTTGLTAYRLSAESKGGRKLSEAERLDYAINVINRTQFGYQQQNEARYLGKHGVAGAYTPLAFQFQKFAFFTTQNYIRLFSDGFIEKNLPADQKAEARRALAGTMTAAALVAGTMGLPFATVVAAVANGMSDDDRDARARYRMWLASVFGDQMAELIAKGPISRGLGIDLTGSLGQQDLIPGSRFAADRRAFDDKVKDISKSMLGPAINGGFDIYSGLMKVKDGDLMAGLKQVLPRALKGPTEAANTAMHDGFTNKAGQKLDVPVHGADYAKMVLGWTPRQKAEQSEANFYYQSELGQRKQDKKKAVAEVKRDAEAGNYDAMAATVAAWNYAHPDNPITSVNSLLQSTARGTALGSMTGSGIIESNSKHLPILRKYGYANVED